MGLVWIKKGGRFYIPVSFVSFGVYNRLNYFLTIPFSGFIGIELEAFQLAKTKFLYLVTVKKQAFELCPLLKARLSPMFTFQMDSKIRDISTIYLRRLPPLDTIEPLLR